MDNTIEHKIATAGGIAVIACIVAVVALVAAIGNGGAPDAPKGVTGFDLQMAVERCIPVWDATFEQELACYQAVYGYKPDSKE
jgi:hypothetical protein